MSEKLSPMQEQLLGQASNILQAVTDAVGKATNIAVEQLPDIAVQYVAYGRATNSFMVLFGVALLVFFWWIVFRVCIGNKYKIDTEGRIFIGGIAGAFTLIAGLAVTLSHISSFFMVWVAPKVWLIREIVHLVK